MRTFALVIGKGLHLGRLAEWLGTGLQNRLRRFESATDLQQKRDKSNGLSLFLLLVCSVLCAKHLSYNLYLRGEFVEQMLHIVIYSDHLYYHSIVIYCPSE